MEKKIYTIPVEDSFLSGDECPFCDLERQTEQRAIRYFAGAGASYMEPEIREITNRTGFCSCHMKKLYDYGNPLGSALMLQTHMAQILQELQERADRPEVPQRRLFRKKQAGSQQPYWQRLQARVASCAICDQVESNMQRQYRVFFGLLEKAEFREQFVNCKGFCLPHFARVLQEAPDHLPRSQEKWFYPAIYALMEDNLNRVKEDLDWMIARYDYRNAGKPAGNSRDALQRTMQKLEGIYPADPPYRKD